MSNQDIPKSLLELKAALYVALLDKDVDSLTDNEVELMYLLTLDGELKDAIDKAAATSSADDII